MSRIAYVDGAYVPHARARVHVEDRGLQFADAIYEVWGVRNGVLLDAEGHGARLLRSLAEMKIAAPISTAGLQVVLKEMLRRNRLRDGLLYLQITRGAAPRDHAFPEPAVRPTLILTARAQAPAAVAARAAAGVKVITTPEIRWGRCDIKTTALTPNVLAKQAARAAGASEAWFVDRDGRVTEGASTNAWIVTGDGALVTREATANILRGVTRAALLSLAAELQLRVEERAFTVAEAKAAREAFLSSATGAAISVIAIDGAPVGAGVPGPVAQRLRAFYLERAGPALRAAAGLY